MRLGNLSFTRRSVEFLDQLGQIFENMEHSWRSKHYGRITGGELERWIRQFDAIWRERQEFLGIKEDSGQWLDSFEKIAAIPNWIALYDMDLLRLGSEMIAHSGVAEGFLEAAKNGRHALLEFVEDLREITPVDAARALPAAMAMLGNLEAIALYSRSINDMVVAARAGDADAMWQAVSVDAYVLSSPFFLAGIRIDQLAGDDGFTALAWRHVSGPNRRRYENVKLRWTEYLLRDQGAFEACSREEIYALVVEHLRLYDAAGQQRDPKSALFAMFRKWQKQAGIQNPRFGFSVKKKA